MDGCEKPTEPYKPCLIQYKSHLELFLKIGKSKSIFASILDVDSAEGSIHEVLCPDEYVLAFHYGSELPVSQQRRVALLDEWRTCESTEVQFMNLIHEPPRPVTPKQLYEALMRKTPPRFPNGNARPPQFTNVEDWKLGKASISHDERIRKIFMESPDAESFSALLASVTPDFVMGVAPFIETYARSRPTFRFQLGKRRKLPWKGFIMESHFTFFASRKSATLQKDTRGKGDERLCRFSQTLPSITDVQVDKDASKLCHIYQSSFSLLVVGISRRVWDAFTFVDGYYEGPDGEDKLAQLDMTDGDFCGEPATRGATDANLGFLEPEQHFYAVLNYRLRNAVYDQQTAIDSLRSNFDEHDAFLETLTKTKKRSESKSAAFNHWRSDYKKILVTVESNMQHNIQAYDESAKGRIQLFLKEAGLNDRHEECTTLVEGIDNSYAYLRSGLAEIQGIIKKFDCTSQKFDKWISLGDNQNINQQKNLTDQNNGLMPLSLAFGALQATTGSSERIVSKMLFLVVFFYAIVKLYNIGWRYQPHEWLWEKVKASLPISATPWKKSLVFESNNRGSSGEGYERAEICQIGEAGAVDANSSEEDNGHDDSGDDHDDDAGDDGDDGDDGGDGFDDDGNRNMIEYQKDDRKDNEDGIERGTDCNVGGEGHVDIEFEQADDYGLADHSEARAIHCSAMKNSPDGHKTRSMAGDDASLQRLDAPKTRQYFPGIFCQLPTQGLQQRDPEIPLKDLRRPEACFHSSELEKGLFGQQYFVRHISGHGIYSAGASRSNSTKMVQWLHGMPRGRSVLSRDSTLPPPCTSSRNSMHISPISLWKHGIKNRETVFAHHHDSGHMKIESCGNENHGRNRRGFWIHFGNDTRDLEHGEFMS